MTGIIASAGTAIVGIVGIIATYRSGQRQQGTAITIARMQIESQERMTREQRHQQRLEKAYEPLLHELDSPLSGLSLHGSQLVCLSACESATVRSRKAAWLQETDPVRKTELADKLRAQIRLELVGVEHDTSMEPYPEGP